MSVFFPSDRGPIEHLEPVGPHELETEAPAEAAPSAPSADAPTRSSTMPSARAADFGASVLRSQLEALLAKAGVEGKGAPDGGLTALVGKLKGLLAKGAPEGALKDALQKLTTLIGRGGALDKAGAAAGGFKELATLHRLLGGATLAGPGGAPIVKADAALAQMLLHAEKPVVAETVKAAQQGEVVGFAGLAAGAPTLQAHLAKNLEPDAAGALLRSVVAEPGVGADAKGGAVSRMLTHTEPEAKPALLRDLRADVGAFTNVVIVLMRVPDPPPMQTLLAGTCACNAQHTEEALKRIAHYTRELDELYGMGAPSPGDAARANRGLRELESFVATQDDEYKKRLREKKDEKARR